MLRIISYRSDNISHEVKFIFLYDFTSGFCQATPFMKFMIPWSRFDFIYTL